MTDRAADAPVSTALVLVDVQRNMLEGETPVPGASEIGGAIESLLARARHAGATVVHVQNDGPPGDPDEPGTTGWELVFPPRPDELVVRKDISDSFAANPGLAEALRAKGVDRVVVAGMQSDFCVAATSRAAIREGFDVVLAHGAHATYDGREPAAATEARVEAELKKEGIAVVPATDITPG